MDLQLLQQANGDFVGSPPIQIGLPVILMSTSLTQLMLDLQEQPGVPTYT